MPAMVKDKPYSKTNLPETTRRLTLCHPARLQKDKRICLASSHPPPQTASQMGSFSRWWTPLFGRFCKETKRRSGILADPPPPNPHPPHIVGDRFLFWDPHPPPPHPPKRAAAQPFKADGPLDLRFDQSQGQTAWDFLMSSPHEVRIWRVVAWLGLLFFFPGPIGV